ncbi:hypothetical protein GCM10027176_28800 [Actinoallomurus bryophytorum]|nr:hypothetical protein [Actinoallomurus bryophytorum]
MIIGIAVPVIVVLFIVASALSNGKSAPTGEWKAGQCVSSEGRIGDQAGKAFHRTGCGSSDAKAKVTKMTASVLIGGPTDCPDDTDAMVSVDQAHSINVGKEVACIRNLSAPHPGDVGQGGGVFRAGDCILDPQQSSHLQETACASPHWGTVLRWAADAASCPQGESYDAVPLFASKQALCVRRG